VLDGLGHDLPATQTTALALTAIRHARRHSATNVDLAAIAAHADRLIAAQARPRPGETSFVTAALARLDIRTGLLSYLLAGHPPPLLFRAGRLVKELAHPPRLPLGITTSAPWPYAVAAEQLEPGDRVLFYSDGVIEARDADGVFFGEQRLVDFAERAALDRMSAPETLRRLVATVLDHQGGKLQDDATLLILDWSITGSELIFPTLP
jgi:serine phosphatase RsbU (regulator of sigma subunit)